MRNPKLEIRNNDQSQKSKTVYVKGSSVVLTSHARDARATSETSRFQIRNPQSEIGNPKSGD